MQEQLRYRCTIMRGGTSKAVFFKRNELPSDPELRDRVILAVFGSPDLRQIDGLGGSDITTSKVAVIGPPTRADADIDYLFGQVHLTQAKIIWDSNCGNISSAVGPYAIDEGMVVPGEPVTCVRVHNVNTHKILVEKVETRDGNAVVSGDFVLDGVPGTGSKIELDYKMTYGSATGRLLPTGNPVDLLFVPGIGEFPVSIVDIANSVCFVKAEDLGISGKESRPEIAEDRSLCDKLEAIREQAAIRCGFMKEGEIGAVVSPLRPMIAFVAPAQDYEDYASKAVIKKEETDFLARIIYNQMPVETYTGTGTICTATAAMISGTVVNQVCSTRPRETGTVRFGHSRGINCVDVEVEETGNGPVVRKAAFLRTARRIMDGFVYVKRERLEQDPKHYEKGDR